MGSVTGMLQLSSRTRLRYEGGEEANTGGRKGVKEHETSRTSEVEKLAVKEGVRGKCKRQGRLGFVSKSADARAREGGGQKQEDGTGGVAV